MRRNLLTLLSCLSLLLCIPVAVLWVHSYFGTPNLLRLSPGPQHYALRAAHGRITLYHITPQTTPLPPATLPAGSVRVPVSTAAPLLTIPHWTAIALFLILPVISLRMLYLRR